MPTTIVTKKTQKALKLNTIEGAFAVASDNLSVPFLSLFALSFGATPSQIGMLTAFPNFLGNILQIPYGFLAEKIADKRILCILGGLGGRFSWVLIAFLPFLFPTELQLPILIGLASIRVIMANLGAPAWATLQAVLIPQKIRGKYYANRNVILNICALAVTLIAGQVLGLGFPVNYQILFIGAAIFGIISTVLFAFIDFEKSGTTTTNALAGALPSKENTGITERRFGIFLRTLRGEKKFINYVWSAIVWNFGTTFASSLFAVYFIQNLGGHEGMWAVVTASSLVGQILCQRYWGALSDRFGPKNIMSVTGLIVVSLPMMWFFAPVSWLAIVINFIGGFMWGGYNLAAFNLLLELTPDEGRSMYIGTFNTSMGIATALGPIIGGFAAELLGLRAVFLVSSAIRALGLFIFNRGIDDSTNRPIGVKDLLWRRRPDQLSHNA